MSGATPSPGCVLIDGAPFAPEQARVRADGQGVLFGDGAFETLRTYGGRPFRLAAHLSRLLRSLEALGISTPPRWRDLPGWVTTALERSGLAEAVLRITVLRGAGVAGWTVHQPGPATCVVSALPLRARPPEAYTRGVSVGLLWERSPAELPPPWVKSTSCQRGILAQAEVARRGHHEGLYLGPGETCTEGTVTNLFTLSGRTLTTPPAHVCLPGVARAELLELAPRLGLEVREAAVTLGLLRAADEVLLTSSLAEVLPVVRVEDRPVGAGPVGPWAPRLRAAYLARTGEPAE